MQKIKVEEEESVYGCSVVISSFNIFNLRGNIATIKEKLKFIKANLYFTETVETDEKGEAKNIPVILMLETDVSDVKVFSLRNYESELDD